MSSSWAVTAPAPSSSRWQSRPTGSPLAQWQGVRVTPHWLPAYLRPTTHPPTYLLACLPAPPALRCPHKKRVRERERTMAPLLPFPLLTRATVAPLLKEKCSLSCLFSLNLSLSLSLSRSLPSLCFTLSCLSPLCVPWENPPVWILLYLCE